ncbi:MAG: 1,4-dihydroxy-2-naphthoate octaprenyltransferase [Rhodocyclales bacterium]|nr:1,4-dihydroxy-2-naphthoate octaprenyltransferase [Rhodocyclales bacterium]
MKPGIPEAVTAPPPTGWRIWWTAARPRTLTIALTPVVVGSAAAWAQGASPAWLVFLATLIAAMAIQIGTNLHNDAADHQRGNDLADRIGPLRVTAAGWASAAAVRRAAFATFAVALLTGIYLVAVGGWPILAIGLAALAAGAAYSGGPRPISHTPFGELFVWVFFGLVAVAGSCWLQAAALHAEALLAGAAVGMPAAAVLMVNNIRDRVTDLRAGRRTLAGVVSPAAALRIYAALMLMPYAILPILSVRGQSGVLTALLALPASLSLVGQLRHCPVGPGLNPLLARTAQCGLGFGLLLAVGFLL